MIVNLLTVAMVTVALVTGCKVTDNKNIGEACTCNDVCLGNSQCQPDGHDGYTCQCTLCQYFESTLRQCVKTPNYGDTCHDKCSSNFVCADNDQSAKTCQCPSTHYYDEETDSCITIPSEGEKCSAVCQSNLECSEASCHCATNLEWDSEKRFCSPKPEYFCVNNIVNGCRGVPNGDYPACNPKCQEGVFISCSNGYLYVRDCALGWYVRPNGERFTSKLVYDPQRKQCERRTRFCPRPLDRFVEG